MLPPSMPERLFRTAVLEPSRVEMIHPLARAHRIIGWSIRPDEHWTIGDGYALIQAIEQAAGLNWPELLKRYTLSGNL